MAIHRDATHLSLNYDWWDKMISFEIVPGSGPHFIGSAWLPVRLRVERRDGLAAPGPPAGGPR